MRFVFASAVTGAPPGQMYLRLTVDQVGAALVSSTGAVVQRDEKAKGDKSNVALQWSDGRWVVYEVEVP